MSTRREGTKWRLQQKLDCPGAHRYHSFGYSVSVDGDVVAIGARDYEPKQNSHKQKGAAFIFRRTGDRWELEQMVSEPETHRFGQAVSVSGDRLVVGTLGWGGDAFVYRHTENRWVKERVLNRLAERRENSDFGYSIDFDGVTVAIAAPFAGYTRVFTLTDGSWDDGTTFVAEPNSKVYDQFVGVDGDSVYVWSPLVETGADGRKRAELSVLRREGSIWSKGRALELQSTGPGR